MKMAVFLKESKTKSSVQKPSLLLVNLNGSMRMVSSEDKVKAKRLSLGILMLE